MTHKKLEYRKTITKSLVSYSGQHYTTHVQQKKKTTHTLTKMSHICSTYFLRDFFCC